MNLVDCLPNYLKILLPSILSFSGSLSELKDDIKISLFDEVIESHYNDDNSVKSVDIYQRIQNNWLGEYRVPIRCLLKQQKVFKE